MPRDSIVTWVKKKIGPGLQNLTTTDEAETILTSESPVVVAFVENLAVYFLLPFKFSTEFSVISEFKRKLLLICSHNPKVLSNIYKCNIRS